MQESPPSETQIIDIILKVQVQLGLGEGISETAGEAVIDLCYLTLLVKDFWFIESPAGKKILKLKPNRNRILLAPEPLVQINAK